MIFSLANAVDLDTYLSTIGENATATNRELMRRCGIFYSDPQIPRVVRHVWELFWKAERYRPRSDHGRWGFIPATEIEAMSKGLGWPLSGWEWEALLSMDVARRKALEAPRTFEQPKDLSLKDLDDMLGW